MGVRANPRDQWRDVRERKRNKKKVVVRKALRLRGENPFDLYSSDTEYTYLWLCSIIYPSRARERSMWPIDENKSVRGRLWLFPVTVTHCKTSRASKRTKRFMIVIKQFLQLQSFALFIPSLSLSLSVSLSLSSLIFRQLKKVCYFLFAMSFRPELRFIKVK